MTTEEQCRICLQSGATIPIFEDDGNNEKVASKMCNCFHEKVTEEECFPKKICEDCNTSLDSILGFIEIFKRSNEILLKQINTITSSKEIYFDVGEESESDLPLADFKTEIKHEQDEIVESFEGIYVESVDLTEEIKSEIKTEVKSIPKTSSDQVNGEKSLINAKEKVFRTKNIATSLLEGVYCWSGLRWSYDEKHNITHEQPVKTKYDSIRKMKLPKLPVTSQKKKIKSDPTRLCDHCGKVFANQTKLTKHRKLIHSRGPTKCDFPGCKRVCSSEKNLQLHKIRKHSEKREFICQECGGDFSMEKDLKNHIRNLHTRKKKKKEYVCEECKKVYRSQVGYEIHVRSAHTGVRPASCSVCGAAFFHEMYLKEHMRLHTGETPFHCPVCGRGYAQRGNMKSHLRSHRRRELDEATLAAIKPAYLKFLKF